MAGATQPSEGLGLRTLALACEIMPIFRPIDSGITMKVSSSTLERLVLHDHALEADFFIPEDARRRLRVGFVHVEVTRTLDEMALSTEETEKCVGLVSEHFAYEATDAHFWRSQSSALKAVMPHLKHYIFITGCASRNSAGQRESRVGRREADVQGSLSEA
jgi:hypothetical protein